MGLIIEIIFVITLGIILILNLALYNISRKLKKEPNKSNLSGMEIARIVSNKVTEEEPHIIKKNGKYLSHYKESRNVIKLSPEVFDGENIYAAIIAVTISLHTSDNNKIILKKNRLNSFIVLLSYIMIVIGAFLNNYNIIHFGFILFIFACIIEFIGKSIYGNSIEELEKTHELIKKEDVLKPFDEYKEYLNYYSFLDLARLPYRFLFDF